RTACGCCARWATRTVRPGSTTNRRARSRMRNSCGCPAVSAQKNRVWWGDSGRTLAWGRPPDAAGGLFPVSETRGEARYAEFHGVGAAVRAPPCKQDAHRCAGWAWGEAGLARCAACRGPRGGELGAALQVVVQRYARLPELRRVRQVIAQALDHAVVYQVDLRGDHGVAPFESDQVGADQRGRVNVQLRFAMRGSSGLAARVSGWVWRGLVWGSGFGASAGSTAVFIVLLARRPRASALGRKRHPPIADRS